MAKYDLETVDKICALLEEGQTLVYISEQLSIPRQTIYRWLKKNPEFIERVSQAQEKFKQNLPETIKKAAKDRITELIKFGHRITRERNIELLIINEVPIYNSDNQIIGYKEKWRQTHTTHDKEVTNMGVPQWALDRVLPPQPKDLESAIKLIESYGLKPVVANTELFRQWLVAQTTSENSQMGSDRGLTEIEANQIRARILGISEDATDTDSLPAKMGD